MKKNTASYFLFIACFILLPQALTAGEFRIIHGAGILFERTSINLHSIMEEHYPGYSELSDGKVRTYTVGARYTYMHLDNKLFEEQIMPEFKISYSSTKVDKKISFVSDGQSRSIESYSIDSFQFAVAFTFLAIGYENRKLSLYSEELGAVSRAESFPYFEFELPWLSLTHVGLTPVLVYKVMFAESDSDTVKVGVSYLF